MQTRMLLSQASLGENNDDKNKNNSGHLHVPPSLLNPILQLMGHVLRSALLDLPVWLCFAALCLSAIMVQLKDEYWTPQLQLETWGPHRWDDEETYYERQCTPEHQTSHTMDDPELFYQEYDTATSAKRKMQKHGVTVYPNLLSPQTAEAARRFMVRQNRKGQDMIHVIQNENRYSFAVRVDQDPVVAQALNEILSNQHLVEAIEEIMGPDPAVIEFTGITSTFGAAPQVMHADVVPAGSAFRFARNFVPSYSLFIPLQNTTSEMGATYLCPGTHLCGDGANEFCDETAMQASGPANNWPMGWGALMNQQTLHMGAAHVDQFALERVLFILTFAPRPRWNRHQVETRMLGTGGSYSLHWSQWGHTLSDFANAKQRMTFPWRHMRSMGLYKPKNREWGWDFWTVTLQRIAQTELGYTADSLHDAAEEGNLDWIPQWIRGPNSFVEELLRDYFEEEEDGAENISSPWTMFAEAIVRNISALTQKAYATVLSAHVVFILFSSIVSFAWGAQTQLWRSTRRLVMGHVVVALFAYLLRESVEQTTWARNVKKGVAFNSTRDNGNLPDLPGTLATDNDVLVSIDYQSDYLASFTDILDRTHVGNLEWSRQVETSFQNYDKLTSSLQEELCRELTLRIGQNKGRFLSKNVYNEWSALTPSMAVKYCDKVLKTKADPAIGFGVKWTDYLISEFVFGYWRDTHGLKDLAILHLLDLQKRLLRSTRKKKASFAPSRGQPKKWKVRPRTNVPNLLSEPIRSKRSAFPSRPPIEEPYLGAWLQVGDVVEAKYKGKFDEWYKGRIESAAGGSWDVEYQDGEVDEFLCRTCVRPFVPYEVGESLAWRDPETGTFGACEVLRFHSEDGTYDVQRFDDGRIILGVRTTELRRGSVDGVPVEVGERVLALYPGDDEEEPFPGEVTRVVDSDNGGTMCEIKFDDGLVAVVHWDTIIGKDWRVGDRVMAVYPEEDEDEAFPGVVAKLEEDGTYVISYDDGDVAAVSLDMIIGPA